MLSFVSNWDFRRLCYSFFALAVFPKILASFSSDNWHNFLNVCHVFHNKSEKKAEVNDRSVLSSETTMMSIATRMEGMESARNERQAGEKRLIRPLARSLVTCSPKRQSWRTVTNLITWYSISCWRFRVFSEGSMWFTVSLLIALNNLGTKFLSASFQAFSIIKFARNHVTRNV